MKYGTLYGKDIEEMTKEDNLKTSCQDCNLGKSNIH